MTSVVYLRAIREDSPPTGDQVTLDAPDEDTIILVISHEIGHQLGMPHYNAVGSGRWSVMLTGDSFLQLIDPDWINIPSEYDAVDLSSLRVRQPLANP